MKPPVRGFCPRINSGLPLVGASKSRYSATRFPTVPCDASAGNGG